MFLRNKQTQDLAQELNYANLQSLEAIQTLEGRKGGTYVVKELVQELTEGGNPPSVNNQPISVMRGGSCWVSLI